VLPGSPADSGKFITEDCRRQLQGIKDFKQPPISDSNRAGHRPAFCNDGPARLAVFAAFETLPGELKKAAEGKVAGMTLRATAQAICVKATRRLPTFARPSAHIIRLCQPIRPVLDGEGRPEGNRHRPEKIGTTMRVRRGMRNVFFPENREIFQEKQGGDRARTGNY
jgi:hypothetical protein